MPARPAVAVLEPGYADYRREAEILADCNVRIVPVGAAEDAVSALRALDPVGVMVRERAVSSDLIDACPSLRIIVRYGVGVDNVDLASATRRRVYVANVPDYGAEHEVSDHAVALYLAVQRRLTTRDRDVRAGKWGIGQAETIPGRDGAVLGLIGCGRIGLTAAAKFRALGFARTLVFDPYIPGTRLSDAGLEQASLPDLCSMADLVSLHAPLTADTRHILGADLIARMKPTTIVINVSRGGLVDEAALAAALIEGRLFGAGLDVYESEPLHPRNPLIAAPNTVLTDHTAWYSERSVGVLQSRAAMEVQRVLTGQPPKNWVNTW